MGFNLLLLPCVVLRASRPMYVFRATKLYSKSLLFFLLSSIQKFDKDKFASVNCCPSLGQKENRKKKGGFAAIRL